jgi:hypothetical protein
VFLPDGTIAEVTPTAGSAIFVAAGGDLRVDAIYITSKTADQITVETITPPTVVDLTLIAEVRNNAGVIVDYLQVNAPRFQVMGNYNLALAANGVSQQALSGKALATYSTDCVSGDYYAKVTWVPSSVGAATYSSIVTTDGVVDFAKESLPDTEQVTVLGIRGGIYANTNITSSCTFSKTSGSPNLSISAGGLITAGSSGSQGSETALFQAMYYSATSGSLFSVVQANII